MSAGRTCAVLVLTAGAIALLVVPARRLRRTLLVERAVAALSAGLDAHGARAFGFPDEPGLSGGELAAWLVRSGDLAAMPLNPDTGQPFGSVDLETDLLFYEATVGARGYRIEVLDALGERVVAVRVGSVVVDRGR